MNKSVAVLRDDDSTYLLACLRRIWAEQVTFSTRQISSLLLFFFTFQLPFSFALSRLQIDHQLIEFIFIWFRMKTRHVNLGLLSPEFHIKTRVGFYVGQPTSNCWKRTPAIWAHVH